MDDNPVANMKMLLVGFPQFLRRALNPVILAFILTTNLWQ